MTANQWAGHTLTLLAHYDPTVPIQILNMPIASSTASAPGGGSAPIASLTLASGGLGYQVGGILFINQTPTTLPCTIEIDTLGAGGAIATWHVLQNGAGYITQSAAPTMNIYPFTGSGATFNVTAVVPEGFTLTIGQNSVGGQLPDLTTLLSVGDLVSVLYSPTFTAASFSDPNIANGFYSNGDTDATEPGNLAVMMNGMDAGDIQTISGLSNDLGPITSLNPATPSHPATILNISGTWQVTPATGDTVIVCKPANAAAVLTTKSFQTPNRSGGPVVVAAPNIQNLLGGVWLFTVQTQDIKGSTAPTFVAPSRMVYLFGAQSTVPIAYIAGPPPTDTYAGKTWHGLVQADCSSGNLTYNCISFSQIPNQTLFVTKVDNSTHTITVTCASDSAFADNSTSWTGSTKGATLLLKVHANLPMASIVSSWPGGGGSGGAPGYFQIPWTASITPNWNNGAKQEIIIGWQASTAYALGAQLPDSNGNLQTVTTAGTSGATAPAWNVTAGGTTADSGVTWTCGAAVGMVTTINVPTGLPSGSGQDFYLIIVQGQPGLFTIAWAGYSGNPPQPNKTIGSRTTYQYAVNTPTSGAMLLMISYSSTS
jgi:hypothetical protein